MEMGFRPAKIVEVQTAVLRRLKARQTARYLRGPIPLADIQAAANLAGRCLVVLLLYSSSARHHQATNGDPPEQPVIRFWDRQKCEEARLTALRIGEAHPRDTQPG